MGPVFEPELVACEGSRPFRGAAGSLDLDTGVREPPNVGKAFGVTEPDPGALPVVTFRDDPLGREDGDGVEGKSKVDPARRRRTE